MKNNKLWDINEAEKDKSRNVSNFASGNVWKLDIWNSTDYFEKNILLQPKREICEYVTENWILSPHFFRSLQEAIVSGKTIMVRSEHWQDYNGVSWIVWTHKILPEDLEKLLDVRWLWAWQTTQDTIQSLYDITMWESGKEYSRSDFEKIQEFCDCAWISSDIFYNDLGFSFCEYIEGKNYTIVEDDSIEWTYQIYASDGRCSIYPSESTGKRGVSHIDKEVCELLIQQYERVRNLPRFDKKHCPIIEFQHWSDDNLYFLQYHKWRDKNNAEKFILNRQPEDWEIEADFVRWRTPPEWIEVEVLMSVTAQNMIPKWTYCVNQWFDSVFFEYHSRKTWLAICWEHNLEHFLRKAANHHFWKNLIIKPEIFVFLSQWLFRDKKLEEKISIIAYTNESIITIPVRVISDGKRAFLKYDLDLWKLEDDYKRALENFEAIE